MIHLSTFPRIFVKQVHELGEWIGFETRNKYQIVDEKQNLIAYAAEQQKGILGFLLRQYLGHWRKFDVHFFTPERTLFLVAHHPFRWFFQRIEMKDTQGQHLGALQMRWSLLYKKFDVENERGLVIMEVASPIWNLWTFTFKNRSRKMAEIQKKWSGLLSEILTDKDNFLIEYSAQELSEYERKLVMVAAVFIDLLYFEVKR